METWLTLLPIILGGGMLVFLVQTFVTYYVLVPDLDIQPSEIKQKNTTMISITNRGPVPAKNMTLTVKSLDHLLYMHDIFYSNVTAML